MRNSRDIERTIERHADTVMRVCMIYFASHTDREDAFQETFLKYAQSTTAFRDEEHRKAWLIRVAKNTCLDMLKRASRHAVALDDVPESSMPSYSESAFDDQADRAETLAAALRTLPEQYRSVLYLKYYEGYSAPAIADIVGMPENTVYTNLSRGREKLKEALAHVM